MSLGGYESFECAVAGHTVTYDGPFAARTYTVKPFRAVLRGQTRGEAAAEAITRAHVCSGVPPWRSLLRQTVPFVKVKAYREESKDDAVRKGAARARAREARAQAGDG